MLKRYKPVTSSQRHHVGINKLFLYKGTLYKNLINACQKKSGRNNQGKITVWQQGGGHKKKYRIVDFKRNDKDGIKGTVCRVEYDPNRNAYITLIVYSDGDKRYMIFLKNLHIGDRVEAGKNSSINIGNSLPLMNIPLGMMINCVELVPGKGAQLVRSAGLSAQLLSISKIYATIRLHSGEIRKIWVTCRATIGEICNREYNLQKYGKAGRMRWKNKRPNVRGVAMNPVDHPMGGGEGRTSGGRHPVSPWGKVDGKKTRTLNNCSSKFILKFRKKNK